MNIAIAISLLAGLAAGFGAIPIFFKKHFNHEFLDFGLGFSAGVMLMASFVALILPSLDAARDVYDNYWGLLSSVMGLIVGYKLIIIFHRKLPHEHIFTYSEHIDSKNFSRAVLIILAICLHNIPEGLSVGVGFGGLDLTKGISLGIAIAIQNMPEGLVVALSLLAIGKSRLYAFFVALVTGMVEPFAALIGYFLTQISLLILPFCLSFAGGAMLFVICQEIFPDLFNKKDTKPAINGVLLGVALMMIIDYLLV